MSAVEIETGTTEEAEKAQTFFEAIDRPDLRKIITAETPLVNVAMEMLPGLIAGGFGALEQDEVGERWRLGIPSIDLTLLMDSWEQKIVNFEQQEKTVVADPESLGFERKTEVPIAANSHHEVKLEVFIKKEGSQTTVALREKGIGELYQGQPGDEHRLYQDAVLGFGGYKALKKLKQLGVIEYEEPSAIRLNEASAVFFGIAYLDDSIRQGMSFSEALAQAQKKIIYTNHTLVPAANPSYSRDLYRKYVFSNVSGPVREWIEKMCNRDGPSGNLNLSMLMMELAGRFNGVSQRHAEIASKKFHRFERPGVSSKVKFEAVTNGISLERWTYPEFFQLYRQKGIVNEHGLLGIDYQAEIEKLNNEELRTIKQQAKADLWRYLLRRVDQYGQRIWLPSDAKPAIWPRRFGEYKRPDLIFFDTKELLMILEEDEKLHLLLAGKAHPTDWGMKQKLSEILRLIDGNEILKQRVHFVQNYNEGLTEMLVAGGGIWLNTPKDGYDDPEEDQEACGTSSFKAMPNGTLVISTKSGGMAELDDGVYYPIRGSNDLEQAHSLYTNLRLAAKDLDDNSRWGARFKKQLGALPTFSGARMMKDLVNFTNPKAA